MESTQSKTAIAAEAQPDASADTGTEAGGTIAPAERQAAPHSSHVSRGAFWLVPLLAIAAFAPTLGMWFVSDDFGHLLFHQSLAFPKPLIAFDSPNMFYRPVSTVLTWNVGYAIFGTNALPYHIVSLLFHALAALFLGRAVAVISNDRRIGWLAGAIFGVYPLCTEPVAWLASQWDVMGAACVTGAVWGFAAAWRDDDRRAYALGLATAFLAVTMKESTLPLPAVMPFVALATELSPRISPSAGARPNLSRREWLALAKRIAAMSLPFALPTLLFAVLRLIAAGSIGGYPTAPTDVEHFFWDAIVVAGLEMIMPLNREVFSRTAVQIAGLLISGTLLFGLLLWGRIRWPLFLLAGAWWLAFVIPVLNVMPSTTTLTHENNRILYLSMMAFAIALAIPIAGLLHLISGSTPPATFYFSFLTSRLGMVLLGLLFVAFVPMTWMQLQPWVEASGQARYLLDQMASLIAPMPSDWIDINVANLPGEYEGAYLFKNGLDSGMIALKNQLTRVNQVNDLKPEALAQPFSATGGLYNLDFSFNKGTRQYEIASLSGITSQTDPPPAAQIWDFRRCNSNMPGGWEALHATGECTGRELALKAGTNDPNLILPGLNVDLTGKNWVRLGMLALYPTSDQRLGEWFWQVDADTTWVQSESRTYYLDTTGSWRTYWTYVRVSDLGTRLKALRLDPVNDRVNSQIGWISMDLK